MILHPHILTKLLLTATVLTLQACGGGGDDGAGSEANAGSNLARAEALTATVLAGGVSPATLDFARGVAVDRQGNVYVADRFNEVIRKIGADGVVTTFAGLVDRPGQVDGVGLDARFTEPTGIAIDPNSGMIYVADGRGHTIRRITPDGVVSTLAGAAGQRGSADGPASDARFNEPDGVTVDNHGHIFVADRLNSTVRMISPDGIVSTVAGKALNVGSADGDVANARFKFPNDVAVDAQGRLYVTDDGNRTVRVISNGRVSTLAGAVGQAGSADGVGANARFTVPLGITLDAQGNVYVSDRGNQAIRKIDPLGNVTTLAGTAGRSGTADGIGAQASFQEPEGLEIDANGNLIVVDQAAGSVRKITPDGVVSTLANPRRSPSGLVDGLGALAQFSSPRGIAFDALGNALVADLDNQVIRRMAPSGAVTTLVTDVEFDSPSDVGVDRAGNTFVADRGNNVIRKISPTGTVTILAGAAGESGRANGTGTNARFDFLAGMAVDAAGNIYVADSGSDTIRKITPSGEATTLAGLNNGSADGTGTSAGFDSPSGLDIDAAGNVYVADTDNHTIRKISPDGVVTTLAGLAGQAGSSDGLGTQARFFFPSDVAVDSRGNVYVVDADRLVRKVTPQGQVSTVAGNRSGDLVLDTLTGGLGGRIQGIAVSDNALLITADNGVLRINGLP